MFNDCGTIVITMNNRNGWNSHKYIKYVRHDLISFILFSWNREGKTQNEMSYLILYAIGLNAFKANLISMYIGQVASFRFNELLIFFFSFASIIIFDFKLFTFGWSWFYFRIFSSFIIWQQATHHTAQEIQQHQTPCTIRMNRENI